MDDKKGIIIAIDGPAGSGKSTTAKHLAEKLDYIYVDTGAMYRAVTHFALQRKINPEFSEKLINLVDRMDFQFVQNGEELLVNGENVSEAIRSPEVSKNVSVYSKISEVRKLLVKKQREFGKRGRIVMEGRDITTTVFPNADLKIFLTAEIDIRAYRRMLELKAKGVELELDDVKLNIESRDKIDSSRDTSPLMITEDSIIIDTTRMSISEQVNAIYEKATAIIKKLKK
ncbi:MAG: (d)CMP kinase [Ignavibacteria bacterium]|nr:(d)CMP kinase [Ignavibacteria bacterium]